MPSITSWTRLEPRTRSETMSTSLQARIHDPLWLLARQWQFGEFFGEDSASPVKAELKIKQSQLERYCSGFPEADRAQDYNARMPLETQVECESILRASDVNTRITAEAGLHLLRLLGTSLTAKYRSEFLKHYALVTPSAQVLDSADMRFIGVLAGRVLDGAQLYRVIASMRIKGQLIVLPNTEPFSKIDPSDVQMVRQAIDKWLEWYDAFFSEPKGGAAWMPDQMEYAFAVSAPITINSGVQDELVLVASEYYEGHLDWHSFEIDSDTKHKLKTNGQPLEPDPMTVIPTPIRFRGMPAARLWEFEDAGVNFGGVEAAPEDLARLLMAEFALIYSNDHFIIPIDLPLGSICQVKSLSVTNTFGETTFIKPASEADQARLGGAPWRMFCVSSLDERVVKHDMPSEFLFLPPVLGWNLQSVPMEEVLLLRDEMANMAWAVERVVESAVGGALNRFEAHQMKRSREEQQDPDSTTPRSGPLVYRLASSVPPYWFPLIPEHLDSSKREIKLSLSGEPLGRILSAANEPLMVNEEEVPREGVRVTRAFQYARWTDGSTHLWIGRRKETGRGEGSSGLRFDTVEPA